MSEDQPKRLSPPLQVEVEEDRPGDPVCLLRRVCPACGGVADTDPPAICPQCHREIPAQ